MHRIRVRKFVSAGMLGFALAATGMAMPAEAQTPPRAGTTGGGGIEGADNPLDDGRARDLSWLGLLGLAGLLGLRGRRHEHPTTHVR